MALRLTAAQTTKPTTGAGASEIVDLAAGHLRAGDWHRYVEQFREAAGMGDPHRRYRVQKALIELGFEAAGKASHRELAPLLHAVAVGVLEVLEEEPREPVLLNYAGVVLYELGALNGAEVLFKAALRLDAELPHVRRNLDEIGRRRRAGNDLAAGIPKNVQLALPMLNERAERIASGARPAEGLRLSLCMIVKDEEEMLPRCLEAAAPAVDEIIVVDTGSSDRTIEIAESFGAKVIEREWTGDFSEARNASFDAATGDWVMYLDADEVLVAEDAAQLRELTGRVWREAFYLVETNYTGDMAEGTAVTHNAMRVFRNRPEYRFEGRLHEQIAQNIPGYLPERLEATRIRVEHYGYLGVVRDAKEKSRRNIELLERQAKEQEPTAFLHFNLGSEYAAAGDAERALVEFRKSWELLKDDSGLTSYGFAPSLVSRLVKALRVGGELAEAEEMADRGLELFPGFTDLVLEKAYVAARAGESDRAVELLERCLAMGDAPSKYSPAVGCGTYIALLALADVLRVRGEVGEAEALLRRCLNEHPGFLGAVLPFAAAMLAGGAAPRDVVAEVEEGAEETTPSVRFMLGTALYEAGHAEEAEEQFRAVLEAQPDSDPAHVALAEALLTQRRYAEAAEAAGAVATDAALAPAARRTEVFAGLVAGDREEAESALARAADAGLPSEECALFTAWLTATAGRPLALPLPADSAPILAVVMEALLRVEEVDAFVSLLPVLDAVEISWRDRQELLATVYLRRGFFDSAADEWIAVCEEAGPDARALIGLAQVAYARELPEDALLFAREAQALEPENPAAGRIVERLAAC